MTPFYDLIEYLLEQKLPWQGYNILPTLIDWKPMPDPFFIISPGSSEEINLGVGIKDMRLRRGGESLLKLLGNRYRYLNLCSSSSLDMNYPFRRHKFRGHSTLLPYTPFSNPVEVDYKSKMCMIVEPLKSLLVQVRKSHALGKQVKVLRDMPIILNFWNESFRINSITYYRRDSGRKYEFMFAGEIYYQLLHPYLTWKV